MITSPFPLLHPYRDRLHIAWYTKSDDVTFQRAATLQHAKTYAHLKQMHGGEAITVDGMLDATVEADAMVTRTNDVLLLTKSADCQSMVLYSPQKHVAAVLHAGWKGILQNIIANTIHLMRKDHGVDPRTLLVGAAPSLGVCCAEFTNPIEELPNIDLQFFHGRHVDLQGIADAELEDCGVRREHIDRMHLCTKCNADLLWSYRAAQDSVQKGFRNMLGVVLK